MEYDPVLEQHSVMSGGAAASPDAPAADYFPISTSGEGESRQVPMVLAAGALVGVGLLFAMRIAGLRFAFGANIGGA
jgi:hypothetical protein